MHTEHTEHTEHEVVAKYQDFSVAVTVGRTWAIVHEIRHPPGTQRTSYDWECVLAPSQESNFLFDLDLDLICDVANSHSFWPVGKLEQYPQLATVSPIVAEVLAQAPPSTWVDHVKWAWTPILRCLWKDATGREISVLVAEDAVRS